MGCMTIVDLTKTITLFENAWLDKQKTLLSRVPSDNSQNLPQIDFSTNRFNLR